MEGLSATKKKAVIQGLCMILERFGKVDDIDAIIDIGGSKGQPMFDCCPCLTKCRAADQAFWSVKRRRVLSVPEMMRLQGANPEYFLGWEEAISWRAMGGIVGNAMTQSIVERLLREIFLSLGVPVKPDRWA